MSEWEYSCVAAPRRVKRRRGHKSHSESLAAEMQETMAERAAQGWEYLRTDLVPIEARTSLFGAASETHQAVMVFRRPTGRAAQGSALRQPQGHAAARSPSASPEIPQLGAARID